MVVAVGLTLVEPVAEVDVNVPGAIPILVAPVVDQFSVGWNRILCLLDLP